MTSAHESSIGGVLTAGDWLDLHYAAARPEYEEMLGDAGIRPGWRVFDAGCGSGGYLPLLAELVGESGVVHALDLAPENVVAISARREGGWTPPCPVDAVAGSLLALPYANASFDAVWCANTLQYLDDPDIPPALAEMRRVVRPGGVVAVKDVDMLLWRVAPAPPFLIAHLAEASIVAEENGAQSRGSLRGRNLRRLMEGAGLVDAHQRTCLIERWAPLSPVERVFWADWLAFLGESALRRGVPEGDHAFWRSVLDRNAPDHPLDRPDTYVCEGQIVAVGRVPE